MKTHAANETMACASQSRPIARAIQWLENYISENPHTDAAVEARSIIAELETLRMRPAVDELLTLIGQIAKTDQGLQGIHRAKIRMSQPAGARGDAI